jgi:glycosyltransferase involved in cell wall biosynthesis
MGFINYPGVDTDLFKPDYARPREFTVLWVGDTGKPVKNSKLLDLLDWHVKMASKENYISHDEMPNFYNSGHVLINLSNKEGFCRPVIEAMACGLPVISTRTGIAPLILDEYFLIDNPRTREGWVQLNDKLRYLSQNPLEREWTGKQNRQKAMMFSWKNSISRLDLMWDSLKRTRKINEERYVLPLDQMTDHIIARAQ